MRIPRANPAKNLHQMGVTPPQSLGGARLGGGRGSVLGCVLGVFLISVTQNGLNLLGISPYAFKMVIGAIILAAISLSSNRLSLVLAGLRRTRDHG